MINTLLDFSEINEINEYKDDNILAHCKRVSDLAKLLCEALKLDKRTLYITVFSACVHDVGKEYLDQAILNKPDSLTQLEYEHVKMHVDYGGSFLIEKGFSAKVARNVLYHHENYDGTGYKGLKGNEIPLGARIIRICDYWDAITTDRPYRRSLSKDDAVVLLVKNKRIFDPKVFNAMLDLIY